MQIITQSAFTCNKVHYTKEWFLCSTMFKCIFLWCYDSELFITWYVDTEDAGVLSWDVGVEEQRLSGGEGWGVSRGESGSPGLSTRPNPGLPTNEKLAVKGLELVEEGDGATSAGNDVKKLGELALWERETGVETWGRYSAELGTPVT